MNGTSTTEAAQDAHKVSISLADPISLLPISVPVRGEICTHLQCFDLETYMHMNYKSKRWQCPYCNKRCASQMIDTFFLMILYQRKTLVEQDDLLDLDDKIIMHNNLSIEYTMDKGKPVAKYIPVLEDGKCINLQEIKEYDDKSMELEINSNDDDSQIDEIDSNQIIPKSNLQKIQEKQQQQQLNEFLLNQADQQLVDENYQNQDLTQNLDLSQDDQDQKLANNSTTCFEQLMNEAGGDVDDAEDDEMDEDDAEEEQEQEQVLQHNQIIYGQSESD